MLNSDFDHMFGLVNGFCNQKPERSELNRTNEIQIILYILILIYYLLPFVLL
jgi:hypothetical protein